MNEAATGSTKYNYFLNTTQLFLYGLYITELYKQSFDLTMINVRTDGLLFLRLY